MLNCFVAYRDNCEKIYITSNIFHLTMKHYYTGYYSTVQTELIWRYNDLIIELAASVFGISRNLQLLYNRVWLGIIVRQ